ncbi:SPOR domain-containing protein [Pseudoflavitalea sp. G-6-1-2]|uniref:SPOR domain-containing protein n=1 Tax=Pseudoflavitalea sp. G-6-1-2 TaxID=2728841 RepID=UPI00146B9191|nr:SPOR domain-containing protein [Pseudoflavitalea sp. G-6-1-2]NML22769.1 SPOR domain-containing protein [Pseudoflavitalea sp. G-6-1-2]
MKLFCGILIMMMAYTASAQSDTGSVVVHKDARIDLLVKKQIEINEYTTRNARRSAPGYRILVINTNDRNKAFTAKNTIYQQFPELKAYLMYQSPFYKLKVGNFKERSEAEEYITALKAYFPTGVNIVRDVIEVNPDKSTEQE